MIPQLVGRAREDYIEIQVICSRGQILCMNGRERLDQNQTGELVLLECGISGGIQSVYNEV